MVSNTTTASCSRSIHSEVPVKPRCPTELVEKCFPELDAPGVGVSQPRADHGEWTRCRDGDGIWRKVSED